MAVSGSVQSGKDAIGEGTMRTQVLCGQGRELFKKQLAQLKLGSRSSQLYSQSGLDPQ